MLDRLLHLSKDSSPLGRRELLQAVTDLYLVEGAPNETAQSHYSDIAGRALRTIDESDRAIYAERVAAESTLPREVVTALANDPAPSVAGTVLRHSPVLTDADLAAVAAKGSAEHMVAIAQRPVLSESVTEALIEHGDSDVLRTVSGNEGARFSLNTISEMLERSGGDAAILSSLARRRHELTPEQVDRMRTIAREAGTAYAVPQLQHDRRPKQERQHDAKQLVGDIRKNLRSVSDTVQLLAYQDSAFELAQVLSGLSDVPNVQCLKVLLDPDVTAIAALCLSVGVAPDAFKGVIKLRASRLNHSPYQIEREVETFSDITNEVIERTLRVLQGRRA